VPENFPDHPVSSIASTTLSDHDLIIHLLQHIEIMYEQIAETHGAVMRIDGQLSVFAPLLAKYAPGGRPDIIGAMQARREVRRGGRT
jgi:hypothetical protein